MPGEQNLATLLRTMNPHLHATPFVFCSVAPEVYDTLGVSPIGMFHEEEGVTLILDRSEAERAGLPTAEWWACITLNVHSSLSAVGFLAAITSKLAAANISTNAVAGYYHDHLFVQWSLRKQALEVLATFQH